MLDVGQREAHKAGQTNGFVAVKTHTIEDEFIMANGTGVTIDFRLYLRPLLGSHMTDAFRVRHHPVVSVLNRGVMKHFFAVSHRGASRSSISVFNDATAFKVLLLAIGSQYRSGQT